MQQYTKIIDISVPFGTDVPLWPGGEPSTLVFAKSMERGDAVNDSRIHMGTHAGTHLDAPLHFLKDGAPIGDLPLSLFFGPVLVVDLETAMEIGIAELNNAVIPDGTTRILFKSSNSALWKQGNSFHREYVGITAEAAHWLVTKKIQLVGVDYLSVAKFEDIEEVHKTLLGKSIALLEAIDLSGVEPGDYVLSCIPLRVDMAEGSPARAILLTE